MIESVGKGAICNRQSRRQNTNGKKGSLEGEKIGR
jgi:hypothetical protein